MKLAKSAKTGLVFMKYAGNYTVPMNTTFVDLTFKALKTASAGAGSGNLIDTVEVRIRNCIKSMLTSNFFILNFGKKHNHFIPQLLEIGQSG